MVNGHRDAFSVRKANKIQIVEAVNNIGTTLYVLCRNQSSYKNIVALILRTLKFGGVGGTVASESALRSAGTFLPRIRAPPPAPWPDGGSESLRSPCCGLAIYKNQNMAILLQN
ncbi:hypothetical protein PoB_004373000 [Plakobranchus ocellatus]|uniref:Uncharacterized protein n=1 Tax=Plakobranchus ocellatus TaxID=259542 RepID=A0AAV4BCG7_9GAST|nr:hypothetical protein PoB_004373000 [Plakobranchus ocellatus]